MSENIDFFSSFASQSSRALIWNKKFTEVIHRIRSCTLQKITATEDGSLILGVYKPGDNRTSVCLSIAKSKPGATLLTTRPPAQSKPNSFVQVARKHLVGQFVRYAYVSLDPCLLVLEFAHREIPGKGTEGEGEEDAKEELASILVLDVDSKPPRLCISVRHNTVPKRYAGEFSKAETLPSPTHTSNASQTQSLEGTLEFSPTINSAFFESLCEWSLDQTKTKRRATLQARCSPLTFSPLPQGEDAPAQNINCGDLANAAFTAQNINPADCTIASSPPQAPSISPSVEMPAAAALLSTLGPEEPKAFTYSEALNALPTHVRRAVRTKMQFFERRLLRQKQDLPLQSELATLEKRAEGLRANLYQWPAGISVWYVPRELIEEFALPALLQLKSGEKPGDLLSRFFGEVDKLKRRRAELLHRLKESERSRDLFEELVLRSGREALELNEKGTLNRQSNELPLSIGRLLTQLEIAWTVGQQKQKSLDEEKIRRLPYRTFRASTGEFIRVAKSSTDGDAMIKLMPAHHTWVHVMTGEGSHVWVEKPKKSKPSVQAVREAGILALHYSKQSRAMEGEVYVSLRSDIEKKKDLAPGKVIVRKASSLLVRYNTQEVQEVVGRLE